MNLTTILILFWLGLAYAAPPGVVNMESIRRGLNIGFMSTFAVGLGSLIGDGVYAAVAFSGMGYLFENGPTRLILGLAGSVVLIYLGVSAIKSRKAVFDVVSAKSNRSSFLVGTVMSLTNPWAIAFWISFGGVLLSTGVQGSLSNLWFALAIFLTGSLMWVFILTGLIAFGKRYINVLAFRIISIVSAAVFFTTAGYTLFKLI